jgi:hypothetical protein
MNYRVLKLGERTKRLSARERVEKVTSLTTLAKNYGADELISVTTIKARTLKVVSFKI